MFCNIKYIRLAIVHDKINYVPAILNLEVSWPTHIINLAYNIVNENAPTDALYDALLELGLPKTAKLVLSETGNYFVGLIARSVNPDWGAGMWCHQNQKEMLEQQQEIEEYWIKRTGITPVMNDHAVWWCKNWSNLA